MSLDEFYQVWIKAKSKTLKPGTLADYELTFRLHILPALGKMELSKITPANIQTFVDDLSEKDPVSKKELSPATIHKCYRYLRNCLGNAVDKDLLDKTPCRGVIVPRPRQQHELDILSLDEVGRVLNVAEEPERTLIAVLAYAGLRLGEGLGLKWAFSQRLSVFCALHDEVIGSEVSVSDIKQGDVPKKLDIEPNLGPIKPRDKRRVTNKITYKAGIAHSSASLSKAR